MNNSTIATIITALIGAIGPIISSKFTKSMDFAREDIFSDVKARADLLLAQKIFADSLRAERLELLNRIKELSIEIEKCDNDKNDLWKRMIGCEQNISRLTIKLSSAEHQLEQCHRDALESKQKYDDLIKEINILKAKTS